MFIPKHTRAKARCVEYEGSQCAFVDGGPMEKDINLSIGLMGMMKNEIVFLVVARYLYLISKKSLN